MSQYAPSLKDTERFMMEIVAALNPVEDRLCLSEPPGNKRDALLGLFAFCLIDRGVMALTHLGVSKEALLKHVRNMHVAYTEIQKKDGLP